MASFTAALKQWVIDTYQTKMGADDNYVTDAEKAALHSHANKTALDQVSGTNTGDEPDASETVKGIVELATSVETVTGDDATRATTPAGVKAALDAKALSDMSTYAPVGTYTDPPSSPIITTHARNDLASGYQVLGKDQSTGRLYGMVGPNWGYSDDNGATFTDTGINVYVTPAAAPQHVQLTASYMYMTTATGRIFRAAKDAWAAWTEITVPDLPAATTGRVSVLAISGDGTVLLYCNYNSSPTPDEGAFVWRSTDNGSAWTKVYDLAHPAAKHAHSVKFDPWHPGHAYLSVGDNMWPSSGLHRSTDYGLTWEPCALWTTDERRVGIDMVFPKPVAGVPEMILLEGDITNGALLYVYYKGQAKLHPAVWFTGAVSDPYSTRGTTRGIVLTPDDDCVFVTTTEGGVMGTRAGIYVSRAPWYTEAVLLEDITGAEISGFTESVVAGSTIIQRTSRWTTPKFAGRGNGLA